MSNIRACDICYKRKIQCSIKNPGQPCSWCEHQGAACTFTRDTQKKKKRNRVKLSDVKELQDRIKELEGALARPPEQRPLPPLASLQSHTGSTPTTDSVESPFLLSSTRSPEENRYPRWQDSSFDPVKARSFVTQVGVDPDIFPKTHLGCNWYYNGTPILSAEGERIISSKIGEDVNLKKLRLLSSGPNILSFFNQSHISSDELCQIATKPLAQRVFGAYFKSNVHLIFPVLDEFLFQETMETAYDASEAADSSQSHLIARACVLAALSMACRTTEAREMLLGLDGDLCAVKAQQLLAQISMDVSIVSLQTIMMLQRHSNSTGKRESALTLHAIACRMVYGLEGHSHQRQPKRSTPNISSTERQSRHTRRLFWLAYMLDKDISLRSGQPPLLGSEYCHFNSSDEFESWNISTLPSDVEALAESGVTYTAEYLRLCHFKERAYRLLFSPQNIGISDSRLLLHVRQLDDELESWRTAVTPCIRPKLSISEHQVVPSTEMETPHGMGYALLQLEYHYLMTTIHTTARRCRPESGEVRDMPEDLHMVLHSSTDLALEASRSTLLFLRTSISVLPMEAFCHTIFYPTVAALSLLTNILLHPLAPQAHTDVQLLAEVVSMIQNMPVDALTHGGIKHMQELLEFVLELARIGSCAVSKAKHSGPSTLTSPYVDSS